MPMKEHLKKEYMLNYRTKREKRTVFNVGDKAIVNWEKSSFNNKEVTIIRKGFGALFWVKYNDREVALRSSQLKELK